MRIVIIAFFILLLGVIAIESITEAYVKTHTCKCK